MIGFRGRRAVAEILVASPEFERRVAAGASPESISEAARANGCISLWESGLALVRRGETSIDELRRVAAEPARQVTEARPRAELGTHRTRIGFWSTRPASVSGGVRAQLVAAAAAIGADVEVLALQPESLPPTSSSALPGSDAPEPFTSYDAIVTLGPLRSPGDDETSSPVWRDGAERAPLVVTLAPDAATGEHVRMLARESDLVLPAHTHGRIVLATILALLRWRGA